ncbi:M1 family metallopeptidase [Pseudemcibacter aquimaris]|uniref:M1 family metallopeptidase n=1 Tax=Pseudemcibacter aquimaris TaxID=2857064 RepID=UPI00201389E1|nr:M1 family aminopeptidase [Pseudemcibacter aquimaris]MCC3859852.1 M1 family aminopeptidase [Pseudemcibacter aquimaris]WDU57184.1 hypothetical protein KW060_08235 [Pseudemcibacter aquimaris]
MNKLRAVFVCLLLSFNTIAFAQDIPVVDGVSWELASYRKAAISELNYDLVLNIPERPDVPIKATSEITFKLSDNSKDLQLDFKEKKSNLRRIWVNGVKRKINHQNEHIIIDQEHLGVGSNRIKIEYFAGDGALNRSPNFMYTLFVPDRMRTSFPSFDQPNLKATYDLFLNISDKWEAISSAPIVSERTRRGKKEIKFETSDVMSTYLFSFVAGRFNKVKKTIDGVEMTMLHREPDEEKAKRNEEEIFKLHKASLDYMEEYTGIKHPFKKFGFALIPSFQFGGMEHVGAIQYKSSTLMLDENPSPNELLSRAALIAHETAHMWFGDMVTMDWFNDVWTKEVFANFFAAKAVNPSFPKINHKLRTHLGLHPGAYSVDRSEGPNPIRQELPNLNEAGTMYGDIIYNKAPIMMQQLEAMIGEEKFREGIQEYLKTFAYANATWPDLIDILDRRTTKDLKTWSEVWVNTPGRPHFKVAENNGQIILSQDDPLLMERDWPQSFVVNNKAAAYPISYENSAINLSNLGNNINDDILLNADGMGYGLFPVDKNYLRENWDSSDELERAAFFVSLYEQLLEGNGTISPEEYIDLIIWTLDKEDNTLIINHIMRQTISIYWSLFSAEGRMAIAPRLETKLWQMVIDKNKETSLRRSLFRSYANIALTEQAIQNVKEIWQEQSIASELNLATRDYTNLAANLAIKLPDQAEDIIKDQIPRINGLDNQRRFEFIRFALSPDQDVRDKFYDALMNVNNRHTERWVLTALEYLHHPLRAKNSEKYLQRSLEILQEIQITGDIFFPGRWLAANFKYYQSDSAVNTVRGFLNQRPAYNKQLRLKILQETDPLFRANKIIKQAYN